MQRNYANYRLYNALTSSDDAPRSYRCYTTISGFLQWFSASAYSDFQGNLYPLFNSKFHAVAKPKAYRKENFLCLQKYSPNSSNFVQYRVRRRCVHEFLPDTPLRSRRRLFSQHEQPSEAAAYPHIPDNLLVYETRKMTLNSFGDEYRRTDQ